MSPGPGIRLRRIVSGGQTGVDRGALDAALAAGFPCGGWCPSGRRAEDGVIPARYPLAELAAGGYEERTRRNVIDSDGTAIVHFGEVEGGTAKTEALCREHKKPCRLVDGSRLTPQEAGAQLLEFVRSHRIGVLNIAGPRESKTPRAARYTQAAVAALLARVG